MGKHVQGTDSAFLRESRAIPIFLLTTLLISSAFYFLIIKSGHMGGGWGAYVAGLMWSGISEEARFPRDCHDRGIYLGNLALSSHLVCRLSWGLTGLVLCSVVDGNAAVSELRVGLASPQVQKYLALRLSSCITQHLHTTVLRPPHNLSEQNGLCSGRVWRCTIRNLNCDGDLLLEAAR